MTHMVHLGADYRVSSPPPEVEARVRGELTRDNPEREKAMRFSPRTARFIAPTLCGAMMDGSTLIVPRGAGGVLRAAFAASGHPVAVSDARSQAPHVFVEVGGLFAYQAPAVEAAIARQQGLIVAPCGAGKTRIALAIISRAAQRACVLVHTGALQQQWIAEVKSLLGVTAGKIGGGAKFDPAAPSPIVVATIQTLARATSADRRAFFARFGLVVLDEAHHAPARTFADVLADAPCRYRVGVTATPHREDGYGFVLDWTFGPVLHTVSSADLADAGRRVLPSYMPVWSAFYPRSDDWTQINAELAEDATRNALVIGEVSRLVAAGHSVICTVNRVDHAEKLAVMAQGQGIASAALTGQLGQAAATRVLDDVRAGHLRAVFATSIADEGLDAPQLSALVLAGPGRHAGRTVQRVGRVARVAAGKVAPVVVDIFDPGGILSRQAMLRRRAVLSQGVAVAAPLANGRKGSTGAAEGRRAHARASG